MKFNRIMSATALSATTAVAALAMAVPAGATAGPAVKFTGQPRTMGGAEVFTIKTTGFKIDVKDVGKANKANAGHIHFQLLIAMPTIENDRPSSPGCASV